MKKMWIVPLLTMVLGLCLGASMPVSPAAPEYAKWGTVAVKVTQQKYNADILDYKHVGRTDIQPKLAEEKFKLWVRSKTGKEFGVLVSIRFNPATDQIETIKFSETDR
ncbi:DUF3889 domain-containing protein [Paenibacillus albidus]|uniref:DUF3889 domain-containing protein n=1 Tax=Paenibacillus albidus TaxID=2041023 RepID=UPI002035DA80|nr:DUF3889 domain-containing protein [Paenibacillus albidus]